MGYDTCGRSVDVGQPTALDRIVRKGLAVAKAVYLLAEANYKLIYPEYVRSTIEALLGSPAPYLTKEAIGNDPGLLQDTEIIFSGWGAVEMDARFLEAAPGLKIVFYGAGSIRGVVTEAFWERNLRITSSYAANAIAVADFTLSQILFALKGGWQFAGWMKEAKGDYSGRRQMAQEIPGIYGSTVGIVSLGMIGRGVCERLAAFGLNIVAYDPFISREEADRLGVELCSLEDVFRRADVVSLHTPLLPETIGMITGEHIASLKKWATFINTSRGAIVREPEMIEVLGQRPDLQAVLDVTHPEPPHRDSPLFALPNVVLTPHISGATSPRDIARMGSFVADDLKRYLQGEPLKWEITRERARYMA